MRLEFEININDFKQFNFECYKNVFTQRVAYYIFIATILSYGFSGSPISWLRFVMTFIVTFCFLLAIEIIIPFLKANTLSNKLSKEMPTIVGSHGIEFSSSEIVSGRIEPSNKWNWESLQNYSQTKNYLQIIFKDNTYILIPKSSFENSSQSANLIGLIETKLGNKEVYIKPKNKPSYWLGLICLIPLIGGFWGLYLIYYGVFRDHDKWLTLIGIIGVSITLGLYGNLYFELINDPSYIEMMKHNELINDTVK